MSLLFDDASLQYCQVASPTISGFPFAIGGWVYVDDVAIDQTLFSVADPLVEDSYHEIFFQGSGAAQVVARTHAGTFGDATSAATLALNTWHHVMGIWRGVDSREVYVDAVDFASDATSLAVSSLSVSALGRLSKLTPAGHASGRLAEWALYETTMPTTVQIDELAQGFSPLLVNAANLKHQWRVLGGFDPQDLINNFDMARFGGPVEAPHAPVLYPSFTEDPGYFGFTLLGSGQMVGEAFFEPGLLSIALPAADFLGQALAVGQSNLFKNVLASSINVGNSAVFQLTVAGTLVDFAQPYMQPDDLSVNYDGKELTFSEIATPGFGFPSFSPEDAVSLDVDLGTGLFRWFTGAIRVCETQGINNEEGFSYTAFGYQNLADEVTLVNSDGRPEINFSVGTTVTSVRSDGTDVVTLISKTIQSAMAEIFEINAAALGVAGIPATIGAPGLSQFVGNIPETLNFQNVGFKSAITQLAALETGVKVFFNDQQLMWTFPNLLQSPTAIIEINSVNLLEAVFDKSTEDRYTAVQLFAQADDFLDEAIISKTATVNVGGNPGFVQRTEVNLEKRWLPELELDWTISKAHQGNLGTLEDEFFWVYRRWSLPTSLVPQQPGTPIRLWQKFNYWGTETWRRTHGVVNFRRREFTSRFPLIHRGNPHVPGDVIGPIDVKMAYYPRQFNFTFISTTNSAGTPTVVNTTVDGASFPSELRVPSSGYEGTAFTQFGVQRELIQVVDRTAVTSANASAILRMHKDVVISGDLPIEGDPLEVMLNLDRQVLVRHATLTTGIQSTLATLTAYSYRFGKRGENSLSLTTDVAGLISGTT